MAKEYIKWYNNLPIVNKYHKINVEYQEDNMTNEIEEKQKKTIRSVIKAFDVIDYMALSEKVVRISSTRPEAGSSTRAASPGSAVWPWSRTKL